MNVTCDCCKKTFDNYSDKGCRYADRGTVFRGSFLKAPGINSIYVAPTAVIGWDIWARIKGKDKFLFWYCSACSSKILKEEKDEISDRNSKKHPALVMLTFIFTDCSSFVGIFEIGTNDFWNEKGWK
ncbi:hypothetical protein QUA00_29145 [Microcoleus sp. T2B6]|uniref:hypothetical protein n=1 Tax=Microcoleus sp. T2B6 TaxID=3055424 RepID=UPI002FD73590